jgi:hypothetical protein
LLGWHSVSVRNESFGQRFAHRATQLFSYLRRFSVNRAIHRASAHDRNAEKKCCISSDKFLHKSVILCSKEDTIVSKTCRMRYNTNHRPGPRKRRPKEPSDAVVRCVGKENIQEVQSGPYGLTYNGQARKSLRSHRPASYADAVMMRSE